MESTGKRSTQKNALLNLAGRILVGYLIFKAFNANKVADSASVGESNDNCSSDKLRDSINKAIASYGSSTENGESSVNKVAVDLFKKCNAEFVNKNPISKEVKQTVDAWLDMELDKSEVKSLYVAYQQALINERPEKISAEFKNQCKAMKAAYESFRDNTIELAKHIDVSSGALLTDDGQVSDDELYLFNFAQYSQFCNLLVDPYAFD